MNKTFKFSKAVVVKFALCIMSAGLVVSIIGCYGSAEQEREKNISKDLILPSSEAQELNERFDLDTAKHFALKYNLQNAIIKCKQDIKKGEKRAAWLKVLPKMKLELNQTSRNQNSSSQFRNLETGEESLDYSYSSETNNRKYSLGAVWNLLDFGVSYVSAKQSEKQEKITKLEHKKAIQELTLNVTRSYWRNLTNSSAAIDAVEINKLIFSRDERIKKQIKAKKLSRENGLNIHKEMLQTAKILKTYKHEVYKAKTEFSSLLGIMPNVKISFSDIEVPYIDSYDRYDIKKLEEEALLNRPELYMADYKEKISEDNVRIAILKLLPSPAFVLEHNWDNNPHLYANYWYNLGVKAAYEIFELPARISEKRRNRLELEVVKNKRVALAIGIVAQVRLALIKYHAAAKKCIAYSEISRVQNDLVKTLESQVKKDKTKNDELISAKIGAFFAKVDYLNSYADYQTGKEQLRNSIGKNPFESGPEPIIIKKKSFTGQHDVVVESSSNLSDLAKMLEFTKYKTAVKAKIKLIAAGENGAAAALEIVNSPDQRARMMAIMIVREVGTPRMVASLLPALNDVNPNIRYHAALALRSTFGKSFGYYHGETEAGLKSAIIKWKDYLFNSKVKLPNKELKTANVQL